MQTSTKTRLEAIRAIVCAMAGLPCIALAEPAFGQMGFQPQVMMQQWSQQQQARNHGAERAWGMQQKTMFRSMQGNQNSRQPQMRVGRTYGHDHPRSSAGQRHATPIQTGDIVVVTQESTPVMSGTRQVAAVDPGITLPVIRRIGDWLGVRVPKDGKVTAGWIHAGNARRVK